MGPMQSVTCSTLLCYIFSRALKTSKAGFQGSSLLKVLFWVLAKKQSSKVDITANSTLSVKNKSFQEHTEDLKKKKKLLEFFLKYERPVWAWELV